MANTYVLIASTTGSGNPNSISFNSIPSTYNDLLLVASVRNTGTTGNLRMTFNNDTNTLYSQVVLQGNGTSVSSSRNGTIANTQWNNTSNISSDTANTYASLEMYIPNYLGLVNKPWSGDFATETNASLAYRTTTASLYRGTTALTSLQLYYFNFGFDTNSSFYLYGIKRT
jgi:hypothetical protein